MSSKFPIDLKQFKKTQSDKHFTTLKHKSGHELRIAHAALKPDMQKILHAIPHDEQSLPKDIKEQAWSGAKTDDGHGHNEQHYAQGTPPGGVVASDEDADKIKNFMQQTSEADPAELPSSTPAEKIGRPRTPEEIAKKRAEIASYVTDRTPQTEQPQEVIPAGEDPIKGKGPWQSPTEYAPDLAKTSQPEGDQNFKAQAEQAPQQNDTNEIRKVYNELLGPQYAGKAGSPHPGQYFTPDQGGNPIGNAPKDFNAEVWEQAKLQHQQNTLVNQEKQKEVDRTNQARTEAGLPPMQGGTPVAQAPATGTQTTQQQPGEKPAVPQDQYSNVIQQSAETQRKAELERLAGAEVEQQAATAQAQDQQRAQHAAAINMERATKEYQNRVAHIDQETSHIVDDLKNGHIDVDQYWNNKSIPGKIASGIGILLSGLGAASAGQENAAVKYLQNQINANIEGQKKMMDVKGNVLNSLMHQYGDRGQALAAYELSLTKLVDTQVQEAASKQGGPRAAVIAQNFHANSLDKISQISNNLAVSQMMGQIAGGGPGGAGAPGGVETSQAQDDKTYGSQVAMAQRVMAAQPGTPAAKQAEETLKILQEHYVPGVGRFSKPVPPPVVNDIMSKQNADAALKDYIQFAKEHSRDFLDPKIAVAGKNKATHVKQLYKLATGGGTSAHEQELLDTLLSETPNRPWNMLTSIPQAQELLRQNGESFDALKKTYGHLPKNSGAIKESQYKKK